MNGTAALPRTPDVRSAQRSRIRRIGVGRVAVWEIAALAVIATPFPVDPAGAVTVALAAITFAVTAIRWNGRLLCQWAATAFHYLARQAGTPKPAPTPLVALLPNLRLHTHVDRAGNRVGLVSTGDDLAYSAVIRVAPAARPDPSRLIPLLHKAFDATDIRLTGAQLAVWTAPGTPSAPVRVHWLAIRYRAADDPAATLARGGGHEGARKATSAAALRLARNLTREGQPGIVLDTPELHQDLLMALGLADGAPGLVDESWHAWSANRIRQVCYSPSRRTQVPPGWFAPGSRFTCTTYTLSRTGSGETRTTTVARVVEPAANVKGMAGALGLVRTSGRATAHVRATLPLAL